MSEYVLRTRGLTKIYSGRAVNNDINMNIKKGDIYGFIGRNGAGKTTLIKQVAGLVTPTRGHVELFTGKDEDLGKMRRRIGFMIDLPALYPDMTAPENLEYRRRLLGIPDKSAVYDMLKIVKLHETGKKKVRNFSLGMKQRLGIAIALLGNPDFLILDEPVNGLDPIGMIELREFLLKLNREKDITILISSHILGELSKLVTCYGIINDGELIEEFQAKELEEKCRKYIKIRVNNVKKACFVIESNLGSVKFNIQPDNTIRLYEMLDKSGAVTAELLKNGVEVDEVAIEGRDLESYFKKLAGGVSDV